LNYREQLNAPNIELYWLGWRANTHDLQWQGWKFYIERDFVRDSAALYFEHPEGEVRGVTDFLPYKEMRDAVYDNDHRIVIRARVRLAKDFQIRTIGKPPEFVAVDMSNDYVMMNDYTNMLSGLFRPLESGILVPEDESSDLLERILKLQEPSRQDRIKARVAKKRRDHKIINLPANIITFQRAA